MADGTYRAANAEDFGRLYRDSYPKILRTLVGVLGAVVAAEDCAQETFIRAYQQWDRWRGDGPAEAWLHRIAIRTAISYRRREKLRSLGGLLGKLGRPSSEERPVDETVADRDALFSALRHLPPKQAATIILRYHHGYSNREMALALGIPESTVAYRLAAAKQALAGRLTLKEGDFPDAEPPIR